MKANKYLCLLIVAMALLANTNMAWAMGGTGTTDDPYLIYNAADMREFADVVAGRNGKKRNLSACAKLMADIPDLGEWTPIGNSDGHFKGNFDGQYHTISGMTITNYKKVNQGLFGYVEDASILRFQLYGTMTSSANIYGGDNDCSGTVVGYAIKYTSVTEVVSYVNMTITGKQKHLGGIVGQMNDNGFIERCEYRGTIDAGPSTDCIGGIVGFIHAESTASIETCISRGHLVSTGGLPVMGGILGYVNVLLDAKVGFPQIQYCLSATTFSFPEENGQYVNGIVGRSRSKNASNCISIYDCECLEGTAERFYNEDGIATTKYLGWESPQVLKIGHLAANRSWRQKLGEDIFPTLDPATPMVNSGIAFLCTDASITTKIYGNTEIPQFTKFHPGTVKVDAKEPTCTNGYKEHYRCPHCRKTYDNAVYVLNYDTEIYGEEVAICGEECDPVIKAVEEHHMNCDSSYCDQCGHGFIHAVKAHTSENIVAPHYDIDWTWEGNDCEYYSYGGWHAEWDLNTTLEFTEKVLNIPSQSLNNEASLVRLILPCTIKHIDSELFYWSLRQHVEFHSIPEAECRALYDDHWTEITASIHLNDDSYVFIGENKELSANFKTVDYTRQQRFEWGTLVVPFEMDLDDQECNFYNLVDVEDDVLIVEEIHGNLAAGTPVIFHIDAELVANGPHTMTFHSCSSKVTTTGSLTLPEVKGLIPTGRYESRIMTTDDGYMLSYDSFRDIVGVEDGQTITLAPFRCTLERADNSSPAKARAFSIMVRTSDSTGILNVDDSQNYSREYYYIDGKRNSKPQNGMNIIRQADGTWRKVFMM